MKPGRHDLFFFVVFFCLFIVKVFQMAAGVVRWYWVNFECRGVLPIWNTVGQGPIAHAVGAGGGCWTFFSRLSFLSFFSLSLGDGLIKTKILSQRAVKKKKKKKNNQKADTKRFRRAFSVTAPALSSEVS